MSAFRRPALGRAALLTAIVLAIAPAVGHADSLSIVDLGPTDHGVVGQAQWYGVNNRGQVAGAVRVGDNSFVAARWDNGTTTNLGTTGIESIGRDISDDGSVFGAQFDDGTSDGVTPTNASAHWDPAGSVHVLPNPDSGEPGGFESVSPNGNATIVASTTTTVSYPPYTSDATIPGGAAGGSSINDLGHAVGTSSAPDSAAAGQPWFWTGSGPIVLAHVIPYGAHALNNLDQFVGRISYGASPPVMATGDGPAQTLASLPGATDPPQAIAINDASQIVGNSSQGAILWPSPSATPVLLDSLLPAGSPWQLGSVTDISNSGYILGTGALGGVAHTFLILGSAPAGISGTLSDVASGDGIVSSAPASSEGLAGVTVRVSGTTDSGAPFSTDLITDAAGRYSTPVDAGSYTVTPVGDPTGRNGGTWTAQTCSGTASATGDRCALSHLAADGKATGDFKYTSCSATDRHPNGKPPTGCPVVFIPGFLGSRIACNSGEEWPNPVRPDFADLTQQLDGVTNGGQPGTCQNTSAVIPGDAGLVSNVGPVDVYGSGLAYLQSITGNNAYTFTYDWRRSPDLAVPLLDAKIDEILRNTKASRVVIVAHSMGGLVTRAYVDDATRANKVSRVVTLGTPYWGAAKSHFALLEGDTDSPDFSSLDITTSASALRTFAGRAGGMFWLYPSARLGPWLSVPSRSRADLTQSGLDGWINTLDGNSQLLDQALAGHARLDGFKTNGIDYEAIVGTGVPTVDHMKIVTGGLMGTTYLHYASGDGTVTAQSGSQGAFKSGTPLGDNVPIHYTCGIGHMGLTGDPATQVRMKAFILTGDHVVDSKDRAADNCPMSGNEWDVFNLSPFSRASRLSVDGASMSLLQATQQRLVSTFQVDGRSTIVTDGRHPVSLSVSGSNVTVQARAINADGSTGKPTDYTSKSGGLTLTPSRQVVTAKGKTLRPVTADTRAPVTKATVTKQGKKYRVKLVARDASGIGRTGYRLSKKGPTLRYVKTLKLTKAQVKALTFSSTDTFGNAEKTKHASVPR